MHHGRLPQEADREILMEECGTPTHRTKHPAIVSSLLIAKVGYLLEDEGVFP
jgi:hypothetical protein